MEKRTATRTLLTVILAALLMETGCATNFSVYVDSISDTNRAVGSLYVLHSGMDDVPNSDLTLREYAAYIERALWSRGYRPADASEKPDIAIFIAYGIGDPRSESYSYSVPIYGQKGGGTATYSGTTSGPGGTGHSSGTITQQSTYGVVGSQTISGSATTHFRYLSLEAFVASSVFKGKAPIPVWKTTAASRGTSNDLRRVMPVLVGAAAEYIGTNTGQKIRKNMSETDEWVQYVQGLSAQDP